uniref:Uncharacterized protein n=1 Tax=viral metagenome TaxID=1070528 RepID=A0A6H2A4D8_9ZZZZ
MVPRWFFLSLKILSVGPLSVILVAAFAVAAIFGSLAWAAAVPLERFKDDLDWWAHGDE